MATDIIDFPSNPIAAQKYTSPSGALYMFDGLGWIAAYGPSVTGTSRIRSAIPHLTTSPHPPVDPATNDLWYSTISGFLFLWYDDGDTIQWVVANPGRGSEIGPQGPIGDTGAAGAPGPAGPTGPTGTDAAAHPYVRIESYGGGLGGDDSAAFTAAVADGRLIALDSKTVYNLKNVVVPVNSPCPGIVSLGGLTRIVPPAGYVNSDFFFNVEKEHDFSFEGLFFDMPISVSPFTAYLFNSAIRFMPISKRGRNYRVENCSFSGGYNAVVGVGYIIEESVFAGNYVTSALGDSFSFNAMINCQIVDNVFEASGLMAAVAPGLSYSGTIRTGTNNQLDMTLNLTIARNLISSCGVLSSNSAIDCYSGAARNIRIESNILSYNGNGIELKTEQWIKPVPLPPGASDVYEDNVVANNTIRLFSTTACTGISIHHASGPQAAKGKAANMKIAGNIISSTSDVAAGAIAHYAIAVAGHDNVLIDSNQIFNTGHGITVGGDGPIGNTSDNIVISNNMVDVVDVAVQQSGGTVNHLYIRNNPMLRTSAANGSAAIVVASFPTNDLEISGNRIENLATGRQAMTLSQITNGRITDNTILAQGIGGVLQTPTSDRIKFRDNDVVSAVGPAFSLATGTNIEVQGNNIEVPVGSTTVSGAAPYLAANNIRGLRTVIPDATVGGTLGDIFLDATAVTRGWRCTMAGGAGIAVWTVI